MIMNWRARLVVLASVLVVLSSTAGHAGTWLIVDSASGSHPTYTTGYGTFICGPISGHASITLDLGTTTNWVYVHKLGDPACNIDYMDDIPPGLNLQIVRQFEIPQNAVVISAKFKWYVDNFGTAYLNGYTLHTFTSASGCPTQCAEAPNDACWSAAAPDSTRTVPVSWFTTGWNSVMFNIQNVNGCGNSAMGIGYRMEVYHNRAPVAQNDSYTMYKNQTLTVSAPGVLGNDSDPDGEALVAELVSGPTVGTLTLNSNGSFTYTPPAGYTGQVTFTYRARQSSYLSGETNIYS
ncbi:MAG: Ig-like domain-containing protein, partial [Candidatus Bipolaricaulota bacterium]|nr:Ig-like domain-containing protein [Candidatus Bipolaricaulota bacterium]